MDNIIVVNKDKDYTSRDVVNVIGKIFNTKKVGHTGTLDPLATGVLIVCMNKALKVVDLITASDKEYIAKVVLGIDTDTLDITGNIINECRTNVNVDMVKSVLNSFIGKSIQEVPKYSAVKVNGKKLYEYARSGKKIEVKAREIEIYAIDLIEVSSKNNEITFRVHCSKGTYIRSLCEDIATKFETVGYMKSLKRTQVGNFKIDNSITIEELKNLIENNENIDIDDILKNKIITAEEIFKKFQSINLDEKKLEMFLNGVMLTQNLDEGVYKIYNKNSEFIGTGTIKNKLLKRDIIL